MSKIHKSITEADAQIELHGALKNFINAEIDYLRIPLEAASKFEPSQIGTIIGTLTDALLPHLAISLGIGLHKGPGILGNREGYPDFIHDSGYRLELKGLFKDNPNIPLKRPPTPREASARLTQKVTPKNVLVDKDALLLLVYQLAPNSTDSTCLSPVIVDLGIFPVIECIKARDHRLSSGGGIWFGDFETPAILSKSGKRKIALGGAPDKTSYGRKESEGHDFNEDTNFGKLKRIPFKSLQEFLAKHGVAYASVGTYPEPWRIGNESHVEDEAD